MRSAPHFMRNVSWNKRVFHIEGLYRYLFEFKGEIDIVMKLKITFSYFYSPYIMSKKAITSKHKRKPISDFLIPTIIDKVGGQERAYDIYSRLLEDRVIFLGDAIDSMVANTVIAQLLFLEKQDPKAPITLYVNSPG